MQQFIENRPFSVASLDLQLSALASVEAGSSAFLSCFLDARSGTAACRDYLTDRYLQLAEGMPDTQRKHLDEAFTMVDAAFGHHWPKDTQTIAVFARPGTEERFLQILPLIDAVPARVDWYRLPQLLPLMETASSSLRFRLLMSLGRAMHVIDVADGQVVTRAWASARIVNHRVAEEAGLDAQMLAVRRALTEWSGLPLVVAGPAADLDAVLNWLPGRSKTRFIERLAVPEHLDFNQAVRFVIDDREDRRKLEAQLEVARLLRASRSHGLAVLGPLACLDALRTGQVETMVLSRGASLPQVWHCGACDAGFAGAIPVEHCRVCDHKTLSLFDFGIEMAWMARRNGVNIVFSDADELRYLGGVGCLLMQPADAQALPVPAVPRRFDLVA
jgi:hypothetical protein